MTTTASTERRDRWLVLLLAAVLTGIVTVLLGVSAAGTASAATVSSASSSSTTSGPALQTRVGVSTSGLILVVGSSEIVRPGQGRGDGLSQPQVVSGLCVAAEGGGEAASAARGGVYTLRDEAGNVVRTGRTNNLAARQVAHANDPVLGDFEFNPEYRTDVYAEQRGLEQMLYDRYPGAQAANGGYNFIRGISPSNPNLDFYTQSASDFLARLGGG